jgi:hypothetical protein
MKDHPADHYLRIYRVKLAMAEDGTLRPTATALAFFRRFVAALEALDVNAPVRLETMQAAARFAFHRCAFGGVAGGDATQGRHLTGFGHNRSVKVMK